MALYSYSIDEFVNRVAGDLQAIVEPKMELVVFKVLTEVYSQLQDLTPVDTGYLRASLTTQLNSEPVTELPAKTSNKPGEYTYLQRAAIDGIGKFELGDIVAIGYTANYATYVEDYYHMMKLVQMSLTNIVESAVNDVAGA
jgi:hypothetical protein